MVFKTISFPQCFRIDKYQLIIVALKKHKTSKQTNQSNETYRIEEKGMLALKKYADCVLKSGFYIKEIGSSYYHNTVSPEFRIPKISS